MQTHNTPREETVARRRLLRRLFGDRGSVMLEFAMMAPLALAVIGFTIDFAHLTLTRQQLDICSRFAADVESMKATKFGELKIKSSGGVQNTIRSYLVYTTQHPLLANRKMADVYVRYRQEGLPLLPVGAFLNGSGENLLPSDAPAATKLITGFFSSALKRLTDLLSFRTVRYLTEPFAADYLLGASISMKTNTLFPETLYSSLGGGIGWDNEKKDFLVLPEKYTAKNVYRAYCYMPNRDPCVKRHPTYAKVVGDFIAKVRKKFKL